MNFKSLGIGHGPVRGSNLVFAAVTEANNEGTKSGSWCPVRDVNRAPVDIRTL